MVIIIWEVSGHVRIVLVRRDAEFRADLLMLRSAISREEITRCLL
jgi:hypothetical protein